MDEHRPPQPPPPPPPEARPAGSATPAAPEPFYRRYGLAFAIATAVLAFIVLVGTMAVGVFAVTSVVARVAHSHSISRLLPQGDGSQGNGSQGDGSQGGAPGKSDPDNPVPQTGRRVVIQGSIQKISGSTWTVETQREGTVMVGITSSTQFGVSGSSTRSDFAVGDAVTIVGHPSGDTITATRVLAGDESAMRPPLRPGTKP